jgi:hypothetical protein
MKAKEQIVITRKPRMAGLSAAAERLGVSRTQLREVVLGNRKSKRLMARLRAEGIRFLPNGCVDRKMHRWEI